MNINNLYGFVNGNLPEILILVSGLIALLIVCLYKKDSNSGWYKSIVVIGFILGIFLIFFGITRYSKWAVFDAALIITTGFVLVMRLVKKVQFAFLFCILVTAVVNAFLSNLTGGLEILSSGTPKAVVAVVTGAFVYAIFSFVEKLIDLVATFFNCWPILLILGFICIAEGILLLSGQPSLVNSINNLIEELRHSSITIFK